MTTEEILRELDKDQRTKPYASFCRDTGYDPLQAIPEYREYLNTSKYAGSTRAMYFNAAKREVRLFIKKQPYLPQQMQKLLETVNDCHADYQYRVSIGRPRATHEQEVTVHNGLLSMCAVATDDQRNIHRVYEAFDRVLNTYEKVDCIVNDIARRENVHPSNIYNSFKKYVIRILGKAMTLYQFSRVGRRARKYGDED